jgi:hypothetical protein
MIVKIDHTGDWVAEVKALNRPTYLIFAADGPGDDDEIPEVYVCDTEDERNHVVAMLEDDYPDVSVHKAEPIQ